MFHLIYSKGQLKDSINSNTENVKASFRKKRPSVLVSRNLSQMIPTVVKKNIF